MSRDYNYARTRKFGGKIFTMRKAVVGYKKEAESKANEYRRKGYNVRVIKQADYYYHFYTRKSRR